MVRYLPPCVPNTKKYQGRGMHTETEFKKIATNKLACVTYAHCRLHNAMQLQKKMFVRLFRGQFGLSVPKKYTSNCNFSALAATVVKRG